MKTRRRQGHPGGERHHLATLSDEQVRNMRARWKEWHAAGLIRRGHCPPKTIKHLAKEFDCTPGCAESIIWRGNRSAA